jgi:predicted translin family RNA/ssDNA-binding protein
MPAKSNPQSRVTTWDEVREEASQFTREVMMDSIKWSRKALHLANNMADMALARSKEAAERARKSVDKVRRS